MTPRESIELALLQYCSKHSDEEAYEFNIKIRRVDIPDEVRERLSSDNIEVVYNEESDIRLGDFVEGIKEGFPWIRNWTQAGRSGGWLVIFPEDGVFDEYGKLVDLRKAKARLRNLNKIYDLLNKAKGDLIRDMQSREWWADRFPKAFRIPPGVKEWRPE